VTIPARELGGVNAALGSSIGAVAIETSDRARIESDVVQYDPTHPETRNSAHEEIRISHSWIPAGRSAWMWLNYEPYADRSLQRANLFVVNPNDTPLTVKYGCWATNAVGVVSGVVNDSENTLMVMPRSTSISIPSCHLPPGVGIIQYSGPYRLEIRADAPFYASASLVIFGVGQFIAPNF
jgi:hypothetical protein